MKRKKDQFLHWVVTYSNYKISHSLSLLDSRRRKKIKIDSKEKPRENPNNFPKNTMLFSPPDYRGPRGLFIGSRRWGLPIKVVGLNAGSTARLLPRIRGQSRVSAAESWPLRQRILLTFCYSSCALLDLLECGEYSWMDPDMGFFFGLLN